MTPVVLRPRSALITSSVLSVVLVGAALFGYWSLPGHIRVQFTPFQLATLLLFIAVMVVFMMALGLSYVRADATGMTFRNGLRTHRLAWADLDHLRFSRNDAFALAFQQPGQHPDRYLLLGIQRADGARGRDNFERLFAAWEAAHRAGTAR